MLFMILALIPSLLANVQNTCKHVAICLRFATYYVCIIQAPQDCTLRVGS